MTQGCCLIVRNAFYLQSNLNMNKYFNTMPKILINDGMDANGIEMLRNAGFEVVTDRIAQEDLPAQLPTFDAICVRSATTVRAELIDVCPNLKVIGRGGVGLDNIDVAHAQSKGIKVINTPAASSRSVAEMAFLHALNIARDGHAANRSMPQYGESNFGKLKKSYADGMELEGKTLGIVGFGRIGRELARIGLGFGMEVVAVDLTATEADLQIGPPSRSLYIKVPVKPLEEVLQIADVLSLHVPSQDKPVLDAAAFAKMKDGAIVVNTSRGEAIDESALIQALNSGKLKGAGLDVFENEPTPSGEILSHPKISLSPHIAASTGEAQLKIGAELAQQLIDILG